MSHRVGICSSCEANYKVPADFAADKAKCKECGGVVEIGDVVEDPPPPPVPAKPVRKAEPKLEEHIPSGKKGAGPSMLEKLQAQRQAQSVKAPAAAATPKTPAAPKKEVASDDGPPKVRAGSRRAAPSRSSRRRRGRGDEEEGEEGEEETGRRTRGGKKKSPMPMICTLLLLIVGGGAGIYLMLRDDSDGDMEDTAKVDVEEPVVDPNEELEQDPTEVTEEPEEGPAEEPVEEEKPKPASNPKVKDPMEIDLAALADFGAPPGCDEERWASLQEDAGLLVDPQAGAAGGRAGRRLEAAGRLAVPALINIFKTRDMASDAGFRDGDVLQRTLEKIYNGKNFGWKYSTEPNDHWYNRRVVELWWKNWDKYQGDEAGWLKFTGLDKEGVEPSDSTDELSTDELDALDDI
jgi:hypothetical protein